jgi:hypothetical protein
MGGNLCGVSTGEALSRWCGAVIRALAAIEDRLARLQVNPRLDNFAGVVVARLCDDAERDLPISDSENGKVPCAAPGQNCWLLVIFDSQTATRTDGLFQCPLVIKDGNDTDYVTFVVALDSEAIVFEPRGAQRTFQPTREKPTLAFAFTAPERTGLHDIFVEITQKNRLLRVMSAPVMIVAR